MASIYPFYKQHKKFLILGIFILFFTSTLTTFSPRAKACCSCAANFVAKNPIAWGLSYTAITLAKIQLKIGELSGAEYLPGIGGHRAWIKSVVWEGKEPIAALLPASILPIGVGVALEAMGDQLASVAMQQTMMIGTFLDASHQMETQRLLQKIQANAHKDYHPSLGVCEFGTHIKSLAASEQKAQNNSAVLTARSHDRSLGNAHSISLEGDDKRARITQFRTIFCDPRDLNNGLESLCQHKPQDGIVRRNEKIGGQTPERLNKDIDYTRTVDHPWTLNIDFTDLFLTNHEEEILALTSNLYRHNLMPKIPADMLESVPNVPITASQEVYMDMRALIAKQNVAENSFNAITSLKTAGAPGSREFVVAVMEQLLDDTDAAASAALILGDYIDDATITEVEPSYHAQMEILTKKLLQNPDFYTNLYDKPANIARKGVGLQAIGLMQKFDLFKSHLRNEANLSVLLELAVMDMQGKIENELNAQSSKTTTQTSGGNIPSLP